MATTGVITLLMILVATTLASGLTVGEEHHFPDDKQARFARSLGQYDIIMPHRIDHQGDFLTHNLHHVIDDATRVSRVHKRDVSDADKVHYKVRVGGDDLHVSLTPNDKLFAPGLVTEHRHSRYGNNVTRSKIRRLGNNKCHFVGDIKGHRRSRAALATCNGLTGLLHTDHGEYFIEPVKGHPVKDGEQHPHILYKRSSIPAELDIARAHTTETGSSKAACGVEETYEEAEKNREQWQKENRPPPRKEQEEGHRRSKRSISREVNVETLIVVDKKMWDYYKDENMEIYVLTIMNMVSNMFYDVSIGNAINIVLVRVMYLEEDEAELKLTHHADKSLNSFCKWQQTVNPQSDTHANHHDVAVLLTRYNICSRMNEPCSTLGLSQVSGICQPHRSCNINEDTGLVLAYTVAHEIGHNFAMRHDIARNGCEAQYGKYQHIMSPQLSADASPIIWSNCSRKAITKFLDRDWGFCLMDEPGIHEFDFPAMPPGAMYDTDHQCRLQYGQDAIYCEGIDEMCATLWCQKDNKCLTRLEAPAAGTLCDVNMWCERGKCIPMGEEIPDAINGNWGEWSNWSTCSRTCGAGVTTMQRHCDNPGPSNGGQYCLGKRKRYRTCNTSACDEGAPSFRHVQCSAFNGILYQKEKYEWQPVSDTKNPCQLRCKPRGKFFSVLMRDIVEDGTPCKPSRDMCINGLCRHVGCDWGIDSNATEDRCGVCHGDGLSCTTVKQEFKEQQGHGYVEAMVIPIGARNIRVEEVAEANNYLAVCNDKGQYYLNGHWVINWSGDFEAGGTVIQYKRDGQKESFKAAGPLKEMLHIMVLFQSQNPGVEFEFTVPNTNSTPTRIPEFKWVHLDWSHCTRSCVGGYQYREVVCTERDSGLVDDINCNQTTKPDGKSRSCNEHQCPSRWWKGPWQMCSATCGGGEHRRTVICTRKLKRDEQIALDDTQCDAAEKPLAWEPCGNKKPCPVVVESDAARRLQWIAGPWSQTCDGDPCDMQTRKVECGDRNSICDVHNAPLSRRRCDIGTCGKWLTGAWSKCSSTCGTGIQNRSVVCVGGQHCHRDKIPSEQQICNIEACRTTPSPTTLMTTVPTVPTTSQSVQVDDFNKYIVENHNNVEKESDPVTKDEKKEDIMDDQDIEVVEDESAENGRSTKSSKRYLDINSSDGTRIEPSSGKTDPTHSSIISTPLSYIKSFFGLSTNQEEGQAQEGKQVQGSEGRIQYRWAYASPSWSECSAQCDGGEQLRKLVCLEVRPNQYAVDGNLCRTSSIPIHRRPCNLQPCSQWSVRPWSKCSVSCGEGQKRRSVRCRHGAAQGGCDLALQPPKVKPCTRPSCIDWVTGDWSQCSLTCGSGKQERNVQCINTRTLQTVDGCHPYAKPTDKQNCIMPPCPQHSAALMGSRKRECRSNIMSFHLCRQLKRKGRCSNRVIKYRCCRTCHSHRHSPNSPITT